MARRPCLEHRTILDPGPPRPAPSPPRTAETTEIVTSRSPTSVDRGANLPYEVDPSDLAAVTVDGLESPYTYSDMTGAGLGLVVGPPAG
jgi:hypothetical protein